MCYVMTLPTSTVELLNRVIVPSTLIYCFICPILITAQVQGLDTTPTTHSTHYTQGCVFGVNTDTSHSLTKTNLYQNYDKMSTYTELAKLWNILEFCVIQYFSYSHNISDWIEPWGFIYWLACRFSE